MHRLPVPAFCRRRVRRHDKVVPPARVLLRQLPNLLPRYQPHPVGGQIHKGQNLRRRIIRHPPVQRRLPLATPRLRPQVRLHLNRDGDRSAPSSVSRELLRTGIQGRTRGRRDARHLQPAGDNSGDQSTSTVSAPIIVSRSSSSASNASRREWYGPFETSTVPVSVFTRYRNAPCSSVYTSKRPALGR